MLNVNQVIAEANAKCKKIADTNAKQLIMYKSNKLTLKL